MIRFAFASLLAYEFGSTERMASERCLVRLAGQLSPWDALVCVESPFQDRHRAWSLKPSVLASALALPAEFGILTDTDIFFSDSFLPRLTAFLQAFDPTFPVLCASVTWGTEDALFGSQVPSWVASRMEAAGLSPFRPDIWVSGSLVIASVGARDFVKEWAELSRRLTGTADEVSLIALLHKEKSLSFFPLPRSVHDIHTGSFPLPDAGAVSLSANLDPGTWFRIAFSPDPFLLCRNREADG